MSISNCWVGNWGIAEVVSSVCRGSNSSGISNRGMSVSNWCRGNSDWLKVDIRLSWDLDINVSLSSYFFMDIRFSLNLSINISLSRDFLMHIFFSGDLDINIWLSKGVQVSICYGRIIGSSINSSN